MLTEILARESMMKSPMTLHARHRREELLRRTSISIVSLVAILPLDMVAMAERKLCRNHLGSLSSMLDSNRMGFPLLTVIIRVTDALRGQAPGDAGLEERQATVVRFVRGEALPKWNHLRKKNWFFVEASLRMLHHIAPSTINDDPVVFHTVRIILAYIKQAGPQVSMDYLDCLKQTLLTVTKALEHSSDAMMAGRAHNFAVEFVKRGLSQTLMELVSHLPHIIVIGQDDPWDNGQQTGSKDISKDGADNTLVRRLGSLPYRCLISLFRNLAILKESGAPVVQVPWPDGLDNYECTAAQSLARLICVDHSFDAIDLLSAALSYDQRAVARGAIGSRSAERKWIMLPAIAEALKWSKATVHDPKAGKLASSCARFCRVICGSHEQSWLKQTWREVEMWKALSSMFEDNDGGQFLTEAFTQNYVQNVSENEFPAAEWEAAFSHILACFASEFAKQLSSGDDPDSEVIEIFTKECIFATPRLLGTIMKRETLEKSLAAQLSEIDDLLFKLSDGELSAASCSSPTFFREYGSSFVIDLELIQDKLRPSMGREISISEYEKLVTEVKRLNHRLSSMDARLSLTKGLSVALKCYLLLEGENSASLGQNLVANLLKDTCFAVAAHLRSQETYSVALCRELSSLMIFLEPCAAQHELDAINISESLEEISRVLSSVVSWTDQSRIAMVEGTICALLIIAGRLLRRDPTLDGKSCGSAALRVVERLGYSEDVIRATTSLFLSSEILKQMNSMLGKIQSEGLEGTFFRVFLDESENKKSGSPESSVARSCVLRQFASVGNAGARVQLETLSKLSRRFPVGPGPAYDPATGEPSPIHEHWCSYLALVSSVIRSRKPESMENSLVLQLIVDICRSSILRSLELAEDWSPRDMNDNRTRRLSLGRLLEAEAASRLLHEAAAFAGPMRVFIPDVLSTVTRSLLQFVYEAYRLVRAEPIERWIAPVSQKEYDRAHETHEATQPRDGKRSPLTPGGKCNKGGPGKWSPQFPPTPRMPRTPASPSVGHGRMTPSSLTPGSGTPGLGYRGVSHRFSEDCADSLLNSLSFATAAIRRISMLLKEPVMEPSMSITWDPPSIGLFVALQLYACHEIQRGAEGARRDVLYVLFDNSLVIVLLSAKAAFSNVSHELH